MKQYLINALLYLTIGFIFGRYPERVAEIVEPVTKKAWQALIAE